MISQHGLGTPGSLLGLSKARFQPLRGLLIAGLIAAGGCDQLSQLWTSFKPKGDKPPAAVPTAQQAVVPAKLVVPPSDIVATVNGVAISKSDVQMRVQALKTLIRNAGQEWKPLKVEQLDAVLTDLVNTELTSQEAIARGLDRPMEVQRRWEFMRRDFFAQEWLRWHQEHAEVGSADVNQYYEEHKIGFRQPERRRLRQLTVASEEQAKQALARLLGESTEFTSLAQQISIAPSAKDGGLLPGWVMRANEKAFVYPSETEAKNAGVMSLDPTLEAAAFAIDQTQGLSNYVKGSDNRYHIFQLTERQEARQRPLAEVYDMIKNYLLVQKLQQSVDALNKKAKIERFPERLESVTQ